MVFFEIPAPTFNNRVCDAPISRCDVGGAPCACFIIEIKIDLSSRTAQAARLGEMSIDDNIMCEGVRNDPCR
jgi:hypothetical protein